MSNPADNEQPDWGSLWNEGQPEPVAAAPAPAPTTDWAALWEAPSPKPAPIQKPDEDQGWISSALDYVGDTFQMYMSGAARTGETAGYLLERFSPFQEAGKALRERSNESAQWWYDKLSDEYRKRAEADLIEKDAEGNYHLGENATLTTLVAGAAASLNEMMLTAGVAKGAALLGGAAIRIGKPALVEAALAGNARAKKILKYSEIGVGMVAGGGTEGALAAGAVGAAVEDATWEKTHDDLMQVDRYRAIYDSTEGADEAQRQQYAKATLAIEAGRSAAVNVGIATAALGAPMGGFFASLGKRAFGKAGAEAVEGEARKSLVKTAAKGFAGEAAQETAQSGAETLLTNLGIREYADPKQELSEGVINDAIAGGLIGGVLGGGMSALIESTNRKGKSEEAAPVRAPGKPDPVRAARIAEYIQVIQKNDTDPLELAKVVRWNAVAGGRTEGEFLVALKTLAETGRAPESVEALVGEDISPDGRPNEKAMAKDARQLDYTQMAVFEIASPEQREAVHEEMERTRAEDGVGLAGYNTATGNQIIVPTNQENIGLLRTLAQNVSAATGVAHTIQEYGSEHQQTSEAEDAGGTDAGGTEVERPTVAEPVAGQSVDAAAVSAGEVRADTTPRASLVSAALDAAGVPVEAARVHADGTVALSPSATPEQAAAAIRAAADDGATSPNNDFDEPSQGSIESGKYRKGRFLFARDPESSGTGTRAVVENAVGSKRRSHPQARDQWEIEVKEAPYGYVPGTRSSDGAPLDGFFDEHANDRSVPIQVIHQINQKTGEFDEPKVVFGSKTQERAKQVYLANYPKGWKIGAVTQLTHEQFESWAKSGETDVPPHPITKEPMRELRRKVHVVIPNSSAARSGAATVAAQYNGELADYGRAILVEGRYQKDARAALARLEKQSGQPNEEAEDSFARAAEALGLRKRGDVPGSSRLLADPYRENQGAELAERPRPIRIPGLGTLQLHAFKPAQELAARYMRERGLAYEPQQRYVKVDVERAKRIAAAYEAMPHDPQNPQVKAAYAAMIEETLAQYRVILDSGLKVEFIDYEKQGNPYPVPHFAILDVIQNNHLYVFSTADGFGTDETFDASDNPLLAETEFKISGKVALANDIFRVVHDYFGHIKEGLTFREHGEENAWRSHAVMYSPLARKAMTTETRGQNSWLNFGPHGDANRTALTDDTVFADQKTGLLPDWVVEEGARDEEPMASLGKGGTSAADEISGRVPTAVKATENAVDTMLLSDASAVMRMRAEKLSKLADLLSNYREFVRPEGSDSKTALEAFVDHVADNLRFVMRQLSPAFIKENRRWYDGAHKIATRLGKQYDLETRQAAGVIAALSPQNEWENNVTLAERVIRIWSDHQDTAWSPEMSKRAAAIFTTKAQKRLLRQVRGRTLGELTDDAQRATWVRAYSEAHDDPRLHSLNAEGEQKGYRRNKGNGEFSRATWKDGRSIASAISVMRDGSIANISSEMGENNKVRNFYNNIANPDSEYGHVTIDTHAVGAGLLSPFAASGYGPSHAFGKQAGKGTVSPPGDAGLGVTGPYGLYQAAYAKAAQEFGLKPRELQSITWVAVKQRFDNFKRGKGRVIENIWEQYHDGAISIDDARTAVWALTEPKGVGRQDAGTQAADDQGVVPGAGVRRSRGQAQPRSGAGTAADVPRASLIEGQPLPSELARNLRSEFGLADLRVRGYNGNTIEIRMIEVPNDLRGTGVGTKVMQRITEYADTNGLRVILTPSDPNEQTPRETLARFYARFGFVENDGADTSIPASAMVREASDWSQTDTPAFKRWFGDSKVVDAEGKPLVVYHGTGVKRTTFRRDGGGAGAGVYFTDDRGVAKEYADMDASIDGTRPRVMPVYLSLQNPYKMEFFFDRENYDKDADPQAISEKFRDRLEAQGYDGIVITNTGEYVAFRPEQIKSATGNRGTFDPNDPDIRASLANPWYYSALVRAISKLGPKTPKSASAKEWVSLLNSMQQKGEFRKAERDWMGLDDWLARQDGKVSREQLEAYVAAHQVELEETRYGGQITAPEIPVSDELYDFLNYNGDAREFFGANVDLNDTFTLKKIEAYLGNRISRMNRHATSTRRWVNLQREITNRIRLIEQAKAGGIEEISEDLGHYIDANVPGTVDPDTVAGMERVIAQMDRDHAVAMERYRGVGASNEFRAEAEARLAQLRSIESTGSHGPTKYGTYQLPKGENYRELLLRLPDRSSGIRANRYAILSDKQERGESLTSDEQEEWNEIAFETGRHSSEPKFTHSHWLGQDNVLVHVRFNERTDADGKRVLFLEEVQSDWHQQGRRHGYATGPLNTDGWTAVKGEDSWRILDASGRFLRSLAGSRANTEEEAIAYAAASEETADRRIPNAPFKGADEWSMLAFKRMVRFAAENGFDRIAWTTGAQQNARYALSGQVDHIVVFSHDGKNMGFDPSELPPLPGERRYVEIVLKASHQIDLQLDERGKVIGSTQSQLVGKPLDEVVGKPMAEKIMSVEQYEDIEGEGLDIGGSGMRGFYDKILPSAVNAWAKKFGARVTPLRMTSLEDADNAKDFPWHVVLNDDRGDGWFATEADAQEAASEAGGGSVKFEPAAGTEQPSIDIVDSMRDAALHGLPLFRVEQTSGRGMPVAEVEQHVTKVLGGWRGAVPTSVHATVADIPERYRAWAQKATGGGARLRAFYADGEVHIIADQVDSLEDLEKDIVEEQLGHNGLRRVFDGREFQALLDQVHESIKNTPEYERLAALYRHAYAKQGQREFQRRVAEEYIAKFPDQQVSLWEMLKGFVRNFLRARGMVRTWTDADIKNLMNIVHEGVKSGRVYGGLPKLASPLETINDDGSVTSTYKGRGGTGTITHTGDVRVLAFDDTGLRATVRSTYTDKPALEVSDYEYGLDSLAALERFAAEEGAQQLVFELGSVPNASLVDVGSSKSHGAPMFSLRNRARASDRIEAIGARTHQPSDAHLTWWGRKQKLLRELGAAITDSEARREFALAARVALIDSAAAVDAMERKRNEQLGLGAILDDAAESAYKSISLSRNLPKVVAAVFVDGVPRYENGNFVRVKGRVGFQEIMRPLYDTVDGKNKVYLWELYAKARSEQQAINNRALDGSENLLPDHERQELLQLGQDHPEFVQVYDGWMKFNGQLLDLLVDRGNMTQAEADLWKNNATTAMYRVMGDRALSGQKVTTRQTLTKDGRTPPLMESIVLNTAALLDKAYKNEAMSRIVALSVEMGAMTRETRVDKDIDLTDDELAAAMQRAGFFEGVDAAKALAKMTPEQVKKWRTAFQAARPRGKDTVSVMEGGNEVFYRVHDALVMRAIGDMHETDWSWLAPMSFAKNMLTRLITLDPGFMAANWLRDTIASYVVSGQNFTPFATAIQDAKEIWHQRGLQADLAYAGGAAAGFYDPLSDMHRMMERGGTKVIRGLKAMRDAYIKIGMVGEQVNRAAIARAVIERGGSISEAAYQAQDILNFGQRGDARAMQFLIRTVPFLNARIQGLFRLYKGATGQDSSDPAKARRNFLVKGLGVALGSMLLALKNWDDERYQRLPDDQKDNYWHLYIGGQHFALPKPFEVGILAATLPERMIRAAFGKDDGKTFRESLQRAVLSTLEFNPVPQLFKPAGEAYLNYDSFTGKPIVGRNLEGLPADLQYNPYTSPLARAIGGALPEWLPDTVRSPVQIEHAVRGYFGTVGGYLLQMGDAAARLSGGFPVAPESPLTGVPIIDAPVRRFFRGDPEVETRNKYQDDLYAALGEADDVYRGINALQAQGELEKAQALQERKLSYLEARGALHAVENQLRSIHEQQRAIMNDREMTAAEKRQQFDELTKLKNEVLGEAAPTLGLLR